MAEAYLPGGEACSYQVPYEHAKAASFHLHVTTAGACSQLLKLV